MTKVGPHSCNKINKDTSIGHEVNIALALLMTFEIVWSSTLRRLRVKNTHNSFFAEIDFIGICIMCQNFIQMDAQEVG